MRHLATVFILLFITGSTFAQSRIAFPFGKNYDENAPISIGFQYSYSAQSYRLDLAKNWQHMSIDYDVDDISYLGGLKSISSPVSTGISVGLPIDFFVSDNVAVNFSPSFMFINGLDIKYESTNPEIAPIFRRHTQSLTSTTGSNFNAFEFPFALKLKSDEKTVGRGKYNRYRAFLVGGARLTRWINLTNSYNDVANLKSNNQPYPDNILLKPQYLSWEAGFGVDILFTYFRVTPELKFNQSFGNILDKNHVLAEGNKFMAPLEKGHIRNIFFSLTFQ